MIQSWEIQEFCLDLFFYFSKSSENQVLYFRVFWIWPFRDKGLQIWRTDNEDVKCVRKSFNFGGIEGKILACKAIHSTPVSWQCGTIETALRTSWRLWTGRTIHIQECATMQSSFWCWIPVSAQGNLWICIIPILMQRRVALPYQSWLQRHGKPERFI